MAALALLSAGTKLLSGANKAAKVSGAGSKIAKKITGKKEQKDSSVADSSDEKKSAIILRPKTSLIPASFFSPTSTSNNVSSGEKKERIVEKIIQIDKILKGSVAEEKQKEDIKRKTEAKERRAKSEKELEETKGEGGKTKSGIKIPKISFFDRLKNFIMNVALGYVLIRLIKYLPILTRILPTIGKVFDFMVDFTIGFVDKLGSFLDWGYTAYDNAKLYLRDLEGSDAAKRFGELGSKLKNLFNAAIIVGSVMLATKGFGDLNRRGRRPNKTSSIAAELRKNPSGTGGAGRYSRTDAGGNQIATKGRNYRAQLSRIAIPGQNRPGMTTPIRPSKFAKFKANLQTGTAGVPLPAGTQRGLYKAGLKGGQFLSKAALPGIKNVFGRIPWVGSLIVVVASLLADEPIDQALFKGIGSALGGILGSFIPFPPIGTIIGMLLGEFIGDLLYSLILGRGVEEAGQKLMNAWKGTLELGGLLGKFFKNSFTRFMDNFPMIDVSDTPLDALQRGLAFAFPFLDKDKNGKVEKMPDLSILNPVSNISFYTKLIPHAAASFFPDLFGEGGTAIPRILKKDSSDDLDAQDAQHARDSVYGSNLAGEAGKFIESKLSSPRDYQAITEHPDFGGVRGSHDTDSYHYSGRAIDIGAWDYEQGPIVDVINQFNKMKGISPAQIITAKQDPTYHSDHVHVAYSKGGFTKSGTHQITVGEEGREFVLDADSTAALEGTFPGFLNAINKADGKAATNVLRAYAEYDMPQKEFIEVPVEVPVESSSGYNNTNSSPSINVLVRDDQFSQLYRC
jgi:hypothetical protein